MKSLNKNYQINRERLLSGVLVFLLIFFNPSALSVTLRFSETAVSILLFIIFISIFIIKTIKDEKIILNKFLTITIMIMFIIIFSSMLINNDYSVLNLLIISKIIIAFIIVSLLSYENFIRSYINIIVGLSLYSLLITYIIYPFLPQISNIFPLRTNDAGLIVRDYILGFHFENAAPSRNTGIFREMGVFQFFINFALIFEVFSKGKSEKRLWKIVVMIITTLTTFSTVGLIQLIFILTAWILTNIKEFKIKKTTRIIATIILISVFINFIPSFKENLLLSINKFDSSASSFIGRSASIYGNISAWAQQPIFGNGIVGAFEKSRIIANNVHNTSTSTLYASIYGIFFALIIIVFMLITTSKFSTNIISSIFIFIGILFSINSQNFIYDQLFYILLFSGFMKLKEG